ncbi:MAG: ASKHA domain-containing protein [Candidatus Brocadiia bacterium]
MASTVKVVFEPEGSAAHVLAGSLVLEAAARAGIIVQTPCGGRGTCGKCRVVVRDGCSEPNETERRLLAPEELAKGLRLACQTKVLTDTAVTVPESSRFFEQRILTAGVEGEARLSPAVRKRLVEAPPPTLEDQRADADRVRAALGDEGLHLDLGAARQLAGALRADECRLTAVVHGDDVIAFEPGDTTGQCLGAAFDVGTTTIVGSLLDLGTGRQLAVASETNPQVSYGDDVVSRIAHAGEGDGLAELQTSVVGCVNALIEELAGAAGVPAQAIYELTVVGNTTMNHLLLGLDPRNVAQIPFPAVLRHGAVVPAAELGIAIHPRGRIYTMPNIAGFVGGDTVGLILATELLEREDVALAVDIGTNGEMVLGSRRRLVSCSTAAGPAFEGARIHMGMRAAQGAIEQVRFGDDVELSVIGAVPPRGVCGSALIDALAELLRAGLVEPTGRLLAPNDLPGSVPQPLRSRVGNDDRGTYFVLAREDETGIDGPVVLTQRDIREVQLAKGAVRAGVETLKAELGAADEELQAVLLAGGFGNFIRRRNAIRIGLLPPIEHERIHFVGNAALVGAKMVLACTGYRDQGEAISRTTEYLELGALPEFQSRFADAMMFPQGQ